MGILDAEASQAVADTNVVATIGRRFWRSYVKRVSETRSGNAGPMDTFTFTIEKSWTLRGQAAETIQALKHHHRDLQQENEVLKTELASYHAKDRSHVT